MLDELCVARLGEYARELPLRLQKEHGADVEERAIRSWLALALTPSLFDPRTEQPRHNDRQRYLCGRVLQRVELVARHLLATRSKIIRQGRTHH